MRAEELRKREIVDYRYYSIDGTVSQSKVKAMLKDNDLLFGAQEQEYQELKQKRVMVKNSFYKVVLFKRVEDNENCFAEIKDILLLVLSQNITYDFSGDHIPGLLRKYIKKHGNGFEYSLIPLKGLDTKYGVVSGVHSNEIGIWYYKNCPDFRFIEEESGNDDFSSIRCGLYRKGIKIV